MTTVFRIQPFKAAILSLLASGLWSASAHAAPGDYFRITIVDEATGRGVPLVELRTTHEVQYIAERLYRITGGGIYRDSVLLGLPTPLKQPLLNGLVMGQDTVEATPYKGKLFWLWGDTNRVAYPLGNFKTSSATSLLPGQGGLDPSKGVDLTYWVNKEGFSKEMIPMPGSKPTWMGGLFAMNDDKGQERLFAEYANVESDSKTNERGLAIFNDDKAIFERLRTFDTVLSPGGDPFRATSGTQAYLYFDPFQRTVADYNHIIDGKQYQAYTPLVAGTRFDGANTRLERGADGQLVFGWKANTGKLDWGQVKKLAELGKMKTDEAAVQFHDIETDAIVDPHGSSTYWNPYRKRWVQVFSQAGGTSYLGELWFAEADTPTGPWVYCRKIITHDKYTFYNPTQHPFFSQDGGRLIYLEGTYTSTYSGNPEKTPRYDYNQMMYRLDLSDPRLALPVPVYRLKNDGGYELRETVDAGNKWSRVENIPFYALPSTANPEGRVAIYQAGTRLQTAAVAGAKPVFYATSAPAADDKAKSAIVPLYEYTKGAQRWYSTDANEKGDGGTRADQALCYVWRNPLTSLALDSGTKALEGVWN